MPIPLDRFTRLEKVAVFLIALGEERTREILAGVDLDTIEQLNAAIQGLGTVSAEEKASIMLEFAEFFYRDKPIGGKAATAAPKRRREGKPRPAAGTKPAGATGLPRERQKTGDTAGASVGDEASQTDASPSEDLAKQEQAILNTLEKLRQRLDPGQIDWGKAGYDFGDGFKGPDDRRR